ncbi:MAG: hypothetical protein GY795_18315 [Desulfobacterales bacterium]|nr:hypothetical protein [Desulfobacterales bacterium]
MEIYIENATTANVKEWLEKYFQIEGVPIKTGDSDVVNIFYGNDTIPVVITSGIEGTNFTGIWFNSENLPWISLEEIVKFATSNFNSKIRYEKPDISPDFYEIFNGEIKSVTW